MGEKISMQIISYVVQHIILDSIIQAEWSVDL